MRGTNKHYCPKRVKGNCDAGDTCLLLDDLGLPFPDWPSGMPTRAVPGAIPFPERFRLPVTGRGWLGCWLDVGETGLFCAAGERGSALEGFDM